jgi:two-component system invasion response regulator UvrY
MIRIAIVDDHAMVRAGLRQFFADQVDFCRCVAEAANGREALDLVRAGEVDVLLMDMSMPDQSGVDALAAIKARAPDLPVLILSGFPEAHYATTLLRQGASGYLNKDCDPEEIVKAIRTVARGRKYITAGWPSAGRRRWARPTSCRTSNCPSANCRSSCAWPRARPSATWPTACR